MISGCVNSLAVRQAHKRKVRELKKFKESAKDW